MNTHHYSLLLHWTGNTGNGTTNYRDYERSHEISIEGKPLILASSDPSFRGDPGRYNPEELLLASLSSCHMLWFLHLCADNKIIVVDYYDQPTATMQENKEGNGRFTEAVLQPVVTVTEAWMLEKLAEIHAMANRHCFIANSVNFPVKHEASGRIAKLSNNT
ncbi:MAG: OsmC family protein [Cyclobacteriaceae bacterium]